MARCYMDFSHRRADGTGDPRETFQPKAEKLLRFGREANPDFPPRWRGKGTSNRHPRVRPLCDQKPSTRRRARERERRTRVRANPSFLPDQRETFRETWTL
ncbi:MAG: hypothetical protein ACE1ZS_08630 [Candidatus Poribacteria bacterium]